MIGKIKFVGLDDWNRPVFVTVETQRKYYFGDVNKLWKFKELGNNNENVNKYYKENIGALEYFGTSFNCEPMGGMPKDTYLEIVDA